MSWSSTSTSASTSAGTMTWRVIHVRRYLPPPPRRRVLSINCRAVLGLPNEASIEMCRQRFRELAKIAHPDAGGDVKWMALLNRVYDAVRGKD